MYITLRSRQRTGRTETQEETTEREREREEHTWLVRDSRWEEKALLGCGGCCQGALVVWKNGNHERRHVTLDLLNR
jgi:hypothetical protein